LLAKASIFRINAGEELSVLIRIFLCHGLGPTLSQLLLFWRMSSLLLCGSSTTHFIAAGGAVTYQALEAETAATLILLMREYQRDLGERQVLNQLPKPTLAEVDTQLSRRGAFFIMRQTDFACP
jgi:hypothetical protein